MSLLPRNSASVIDSLASIVEAFRIKEYLNVMIAAIIVYDSGTLTSSISSFYFASDIAQVSTLDKEVYQQNSSRLPRADSVRLAGQIFLGT